VPLSNGSKFAGDTIERQLGAGEMGGSISLNVPRLPRRDAIKALKKAISGDPTVSSGSTTKPPIAKTFRSIGQSAQRHSLHRRLVWNSDEP
jgi:serine/threonine-protein kinase